jgi:antitoxin component HigA of HigAB toxin-antitoxin module
MKELDFSTPHLLRDEAEFRAARTQIDRLLRLDPKPYTPEYEALEFYSVLVEEYEAEKYPHQPAPARDVVEFMLDQKGMRRADLAEVMGGRSRVSDYFAGKRELSKSQAIALSDLLDISLDVLLRNPTPSS